jgi:selenocysteine-specific elongation factor
LSAGLPGRPPSSLFRLPVDRVFTMKGFGTVITGTLISGQVQVGDMVMLYPSGISSKVRGLQVHNQSVAKAEAGMRTAINFQGLEKAVVNRGDVLSNPGALKPSYMIDVSMNYLSSNKKPLKNRTRARIHTGTSEVLGIVVLIDREELPPGETALAQIRVDSPVTVIKDDHFVIRSYSPVRTIGGGNVLNPIPQKHKRFRPDVIEGLKGLMTHDPEEIISYHVQESGYQGVNYAALKIMTSLHEKQLQQIIQNLLSKRTIILADRESQTYIHNKSFDTFKSETSEYLGGFHNANPLKTGMSKEELKSKFPSVLSSRLFNLMLNQMIKDNAIVSEDNSVRLVSHKVSLAVDQADIRDKVLKAYRENGLTPPYLKELKQTFKIEESLAKDVIALLMDQGLIVKAKEDLYFYADAVKDLKQKLVDFLKLHGEISTPQFKEMTGVSRKYLIPLIEYFDAQNVTIRIGDIRKLRNR